ncbi:MAG: MoxR family ATPase [Bacteroidota bacterium]
MQEETPEIQPIFDNRIDLSDFRVAVDQIRDEIGSLIVGQEQMIDLIIAAIMSHGHILLEGVPGVAKTLAAKLIAQSLDIPFSRIQFTPDLMPSDVLGTTVFNPQKSSFEFKRGPIFSQVILIDEINRAPAKTQAALFEVMAEKQITVDGITYPMEAPFLVIATQNPIEQEGTYRLPEAQLDRFLFKIHIPYPNLEEEIKILNRVQSHKGSLERATIRPVLAREQILQYQEQVASLHVKEEILTYMASIVHQTRNHKEIFLGASPRASISLLKASKAIASMQGRDFVIPEDVQQVANAVLRHRIIITPEREMEGATPDEVVKGIVEQIDVPR